MNDGYKEPPELDSEPVRGDGRFWDVNRYFLKGETRQHRQSGRAVLLIHAATVSRRMFMEPAGGFLKHLLDVQENGRPRFDVYTLDWRSSNLLFKNWGEGGQGRDFCDYRVDRVAEDVRKGIMAVRDFRRDNKSSEDERLVHVVAHCMGSAATAQALATEPDKGEEELPVGHTVLATIALFYRLGADSWLKLADDRFTELEAPNDPRHFISPHVVDDPTRPWPDGLERMFTLWRDTVLAHGCRSDFCDRLWFLYGGDYRAMDMLAMHDAARPGGLRAQFGAMPVGLYRHAIENSRRGWAARWDCPDSQVEEFLNPDRFANRSITLISGTENQVWHRDSVDRMYEWLRRAWPHDDASRGRVFLKKVFPRYGHIDLFWSSEAHREVFPYLVKQLVRPIGQAAASTTARAPASQGVAPARV